MSEIVALSRLLFAQHRRVFFGFFVVTGVLFFSLLICKNVIGAPMTAIEALVVAGTVIPTGFGILWGVLLLDFFRMSDVTGLSGMYDAWLLRSPIATWKLVLVPLAFKTIWMCCLAILLGMATWMSAGSISFPWLNVSLTAVAASLIGISVSAMLWRPVRSEWSRLILLALTLVAGFLAVTLASMGMAMPLALPLRLASGFALLLIVLVVVWMAYQSLELSRTHAMGLVGAEPGAFQFGSLAKPETCSEHRFDSPRSALVWHDRTRSKRVAGSYLRWFAIGFFLFCASLAPPFGVWLAMTVILWLVIVSISASTLIEPTVWGTQSSLPDYLLASPISVDTLAWDRMRYSFVAAMKMGVLVLACSVLGFFLVGYHNTALAGWGLSSVDSLKPGLSPDDQTVLLSRSLAAIGLSTITLLVTFIPSTVAASASGRNSVGVWLSIVYIGGLMVLVGIGIRWFMSHSDWESVRHELALIPDWLPTLAAIGLGLKAAAMIAAATIAISRGDLNPSRAIWMTIAWAVLVVCVGFAVGTLAPHRWITPIRVMTSLAVLVPLAGVYLMPTMVRWNLHR